MWQRLGCLRRINNSTLQSGPDTYCTTSLFDSCCIWDEKEFSFGNVIKSEVLRSVHLTCECYRGKVSCLRISHVENCKYHDMCYTGPQVKQLKYVSAGIFINTSSCNKGQWYFKTPLPRQPSSRLTNHYIWEFEQFGFCPLSSSTSFLRKLQQLWLC